VEEVLRLLPPVAGSSQRFGHDVRGPRHEGQAQPTGYTLHVHCPESSGVGASEQVCTGVQSANVRELHEESSADTDAAGDATVGGARDIDAEGARDTDGR